MSQSSTAPSTASTASFLTDQTLCLVKPSAFAHRAAISAALKAASFTILSSRELTLNRAHAHRIYFEFAAQPDFTQLIDHMCSGPVAVYHLQLPNSNNANDKLKQLLGPENPSLARILAPNSLRAQCGKDSIILNGLHCPSSLLNVHNELDCFFHTEPKRIILFGPPSAGKGTQCELLKQAYDIVHISTGDLLRESIRQANPVGLQAKVYMENGQLVPDEIITEICLHRLSQHDCLTRGWVLDGFPRTESQAQALIDSGLVINRFLFLSAEKARLMERACGRRLDPETGKIYHLKFNKPPEKIISRLIQRPDDREVIVEARLDGYFQSIEGVIKQFHNVHVVEADSNSIFDVFHQIVRGITEVRETDNQAIRNSSASGKDRLISKL